jgi:hypothetical protein
MRHHERAVDPQPGDPARFPWMHLTNLIGLALDLEFIAEVLSENWRG